MEIHIILPPAANFALGLFSLNQLLNIKNNLRKKRIENFAQKIEMSPPKEPQVLKKKRTYTRKTKKMTPMLLKTKNAHPNDCLIKFDEKPHIYYVNGLAIDSSVTTFIHKKFPKFNADKVADMMVKKHFDNDKSMYYKMTADDIKKSWRESGISASTAGTGLHSAIEYYYNEIEDQIKPEYKNCIEWTYFQNFLKDYPTLKAYRTEWEIFDTELNLAGSVDMVFKDENDEYWIYDWKRSKEIKTQNDFENGFAPFEHLPNANYWHYALQLNVYKRILETKYNTPIKGMCLIVLHENHKNYMRYELPELSDEVTALFEERQSIIKKNE